MTPKFQHFLLFMICGLLCNNSVLSQEHSVAREWNEIVLTGIRNDFARPTVHARNLFHTSAAMYDVWAVFNEEAETFFLGKTVGGYTIEFSGFTTDVPTQEAIEEALSYAVYRIIQQRFKFSPDSFDTFEKADALFEELGYDPNLTTTNYSTGIPGTLGNYIADQILQFGLQDGSNEQNDYANRFYQPINPPLVTSFSGNPNVVDPNRWQPLTLRVFIDQSGNVIPFDTPPFLSPEWGIVTPFALTEEDLTIKQRDGNDYWIYHDPGDPAYLELGTAGGNSAEYQWGHALVALWSAHLDPADGVMWDISPGSIGNNPEFPTTIEGLRDFYPELEGGDLSRGHDINPATGAPYEPNIVPRADYARVLAEFWADGPDSETPPGHWYTIFNFVNDHPQLVKKFKGEGELLDDLEWDIKAYFTLGGAMHDAAISAWGIKGFYDYIRPICAIRLMADRGQSSDPEQLSYTPDGIPLFPGFIEVVQVGDTLAGENNENVGKIKIYGWRGPDYIEEPETDVAGVGWILAADWWPYQRPSFVTPNFAGYVSGHSTFSRAAAEILTAFTGDAFFPGGMGEFEAPKNEFLVFEDGPSVDITLQWATYRDASDQTSLSRIWGGIHPPVDDIPGRIIGEQIGLDAFAKAESYFNNSPSTSQDELYGKPVVEAQMFPNPISRAENLTISLAESVNELRIEFIDMKGQVVEQFDQSNENQQISVSLQSLNSGLYVVRMLSDKWVATGKIVIE